jgi:hypothetical protein
MAYDSDTFRQRALAMHGDEGADAEVAGHLALAYAAIERRRAAKAAEKAAAMEAGDQPLMLRK